MCFSFIQLWSDSKIISCQSLHTLNPLDSESPCYNSMIFDESKTSELRSQFQVATRPKCCLLLKFLVLSVLKNSGCVFIESFTQKTVHTIIPITINMIMTMVTPRELNIKKSFTFAASWCYLLEINSTWFQPCLLEYTKGSQVYKIMLCSSRATGIKRQL